MPTPAPPARTDPDSPSRSAAATVTAPTAPPPPPRVGAEVPTTAQASTGTVRIGVKPYAEVFVDGKSVGTTPLGALTLSAGPHTFRLVHPDFQPLQRKLTVRAGESAKLTVDLTLDGIPR